MQRIALVGRTNAGKSTLLNRLSKQNRSAVTRKVNTTRRVIADTISVDGHSWVLFDTPGLLNRKNMMEKIIWANIKKTVDAAQVVWWVVEIDDFFGTEAKILAKLLADAKTKVILVLNKIDLVDKPKILEQLKMWSELFPFAALVPISGKKKLNFPNLITATQIEGQEIEEEAGKKAQKDRFEEVLIAELLREQILNHTDGEVPYETGLAWVKRKPEQTRQVVFLDLYVERASQKQIVIGKNGAKIGEICRAAERKLATIMPKKVVLSIDVKVEKNWYKKKEIVRKLRLETEIF